MFGRSVELGRRKFLDRLPGLDHGALEGTLEIHLTQARRPIDEILAIGLGGFAAGADRFSVSGARELDPAFPQAVVVQTAAGLGMIGAIAAAVERSIKTNQCLSHGPSRFKLSDGRSPVR